MNPLEIHKHVAQSSGREVGEVSPLAAELTELASQAQSESPEVQLPAAVAGFEGGELADAQRREAELRPAQEMRQIADEIFADVRNGIMTNPLIKSDRHRSALIAELLVADQGTTEQADELIFRIYEQGIGVGEGEMRDATYVNLACVYARDGSLDEAMRMVEAVSTDAAIKLIMAEVATQTVVAGRADEIQELVRKVPLINYTGDIARSTLLYSAAIGLIDRGDFEKAEGLYPTGNNHLDNLVIARLGTRQLKDGDMATAQATLAHLSARTDSVKDVRELQTAITRALLDAGETKEVERLIGESEDREYRIVADVLVAARRGTYKELDLAVVQICQLVDLSDEEISALVEALLDESEWNLADEVIAKQQDMRLADNLRLQYIEEACSRDWGGLVSDTLEERVRAIMLRPNREAAYRDIVSALARNGKWQEAREVIDSAELTDPTTIWGDNSNAVARLRLDMLLAAGMKECADKMEAGL